MVGCTQENSACLDPLAPEFLSLVGGAEVDMTDIESSHRIFAENLAEDNLRADLIEEIGTVSEEVPCIVEKKGCVPSRGKEESFGKENKVKRKSNGFNGPASVSFWPWRCPDSQTNRIGQISIHVD